MNERSDPIRYDDPLLAELIRILGMSFVDGVPGFEFVLPVVDEEDALRFLRSVPAGTSPGELVELAAVYRAAHPIVGDSTAKTDEEAGRSPTLERENGF
jgi:hypothetical protein